MQQHYNHPTEDTAYSQLERETLALEAEVQEITRDGSRLSDALAAGFDEQEAELIAAIQAAKSG